MSAPLVIDKSYLQGASQPHMHSLAVSHRLLMSEALLYELLSKPADYRKCFSKFPNVDNPVDLVLHVGGYLTKEVYTRRATQKPSERVNRMRFRFNSNLLTDDYVLPLEAAEEITRQREILLRDVAGLKERALSVPSYFPDLFSDGKPLIRGARYEAERRISETGALLEFYGLLRSPKGMRRFPPKKLVTDEWALYRWLQVQFLFSVDLYIRYGNSLTTTLLAKTEENIEHDVLDAQYMLIGVLEGAFATYERKLQRWFHLLRPDGLLLRQDG